MNATLTSLAFQEVTLLTDALALGDSSKSLFVTGNSTISGSLVSSGGV